MVRTRGGGLSRGRKPVPREDDVTEMNKSADDVAEMNKSPEVRRSKRGREEEDPGGDNNLRRSRRLTVRGGGTGSPVSKKKRTKKSKKKQIEVSGEEEVRAHNEEDDYPPEDGEDEEEEDRDGDVEAAEVRDHDDRDEATAKATDGHESSRELAMLFGEEVRRDNREMEEESGDDVCDDNNVPEPMSSDEENEENGWLGEPYREDVPAEDLLKLGKFFADAGDFKHACLRYTLKSRYNIKLYRSGTYKIGAKCAATPKANHPPCPWKIYCSFERSKMKLQIKTYVNVHTCERTGDSKMLRRGNIASLFVERLRLNPKITAKEISSEIRREYQMNASENSCRKAKTKLMYERKTTHEQHFNRIWDYQAEVLKQNPGSTFEIETIPGPTIGSKQRFYRLYMCFAAQKLSWKRTCRPVIGLDGAFLKWDIKGQLLAAVGRDGDNKIVPIAWAVVEIENETNWDWFIKHLAMDLGLGYVENFVISSDKQKGLVKAIKAVLPQAEHRQCCKHIYENWRKGGQDLRLQKLFWSIARSYTEGVFKYNMEELRKYNALAHASLLRTHPETWSRAFFRLGSFCNDNLNNLCESFNRTIRYARKKPLLELLDDIREQCMTRNYKRGKLAGRLKTEFTKKTHRELDRVERVSKECELHWAIGPDIQVKHNGHGYVVNVEEQTCACRSWQMNGIPCIHAAKVILAMSKKLSDFVAPCYLTTKWQETYSYGIKPVNGILEWPLTGRLGVLPPPIRNGNPGRPKNYDRLKGLNETENKGSKGNNETKLDRSDRVMTCSNCKREGHNRITCKNDFVAAPSKKARGRPRKDQGIQFQESQGSQQQFSFIQAPLEVPQASQYSQDQSTHAPNQPWDHGSQCESSPWAQTTQHEPTNNHGWGSWFL